MKNIYSIFMALGLAGFMMGFFSPEADAQFSDTHHLLNAITDNDISGARGRLFKGANPNSSRDGDPALIIALRERYYEMMQLLLDNGAYPNSKTIPGEETALSLAATIGDEAAVNLLLEAGADVNLPDKQGRTPLMKASSSRKTRVVKILLENGANIYATDYTGRDALEYAKDARAKSIINLLENAEDS